MGRKDKKQKDKKKKKKEEVSLPAPQPNIEKDLKPLKVAHNEVASTPKNLPKTSETIEKYKKKLEQEKEFEKEIMEESKLHKEIVLPKLKHKEIEEDELITCPNCRQLTILIDGRCSVCDFEIKT